MNTYFDSDPFYQIKDIAVCLNVWSLLKYLMVVHLTEPKSSKLTSNGKI